MKSKKSLILVIIHGVKKMNHFIKSLFFIAALFSIPIQSAQQESTNLNTLGLNSEMLEQIREEFEEHITAVRTQTDQIGYAIQQLTQALQANKITVSKAQKEKILAELIDIKNFTDLLLEKFFAQTSPDTIQLGLTLNHILANHLLKTVENGLSDINSEELQKKINQQFQKEQEPLTPESLENLMKTNQKTIDELIHATDFIGLTWYNKTYRFLKRNNAYNIARGTSVALFTTVVAACIYQSYFNTQNTPSDDSAGYVQAFLNKLGHPGQIKKVEVLDTNGDKQLNPVFDPITGEQIQTPGTGIFKLLDIYKAGSRYGIIAASPLVTLPLKEIASSIYHQYWAKAKNELAEKMSRFDAICAGTEKPKSTGDFERVYFKDMTGAEHLEELAKRITNYLQHPERYERTQMEEHRGILLWGPPQTGKTLFVKALSTMISENFGTSKKITFIDAKKILDIDRGANIDDIFYYAKQCSPCILFIDEIDLIGAHREKSPQTTGQLLTNMQGIDMASNQVFIIGATNKLEQLDKALLVDGRFGKILHIDYPKYNHRKSFLEQQLAKRNIQLDPLFIDHMAQETEGASYNKLKRLITESLILSSIELRPVTQADFEKTLDVEIRKIQKFSTVISNEEKRIVAIHQAGKALMRHLLQTKQEIVKITILPVTKNVKTNEFGWAIKTDQNNSSNNDKLAEQQKEQKSKDGEVFTKTATTNTTLISDEENKKEALCLLAGNVAQRIIFNKTFSQCNPQDRADAMQIIYTLISQGEAIDKAMRAKGLEIKDSYEKEIMQILTKHKDLLNKIADILVKQDSIDRYQWTEIIKNCPTV